VVGAVVGGGGSVVWAEQGGWVVGAIRVFGHGSVRRVRRRLLLRAHTCEGFGYPAPTPPPSRTLTLAGVSVPPTIGDSPSPSVEAPVDPEHPCENGVQLTPTSPAPLDAPVANAAGVGDAVVVAVAVVVVVVKVIAFGRG
jgi:hypothetical protein